MTTFFYRGSVFLTNFEGQSFNDVKEFTGEDLLKCRNDAVQWYNEHLNPPDSFFLPIKSPKDFKLGEAAAFSCTIALVEIVDDDEEVEYVIAGEDDQTVRESLEYERLVLLG
jgi:hypothetical protein